MLSLKSRKAKIGGSENIVKIDESLFTKRKNNVSRISSQKWIFGSVCRKIKKHFLVEVKYRSESTLLDVIKNNICGYKT